MYLPDFSNLEDGRPHVAGKAVLLVGNFLSQTSGNYNVCEDLADRLRLAGWSVATTSDKPERFLRLTDMLHTIWRQRHNYRVAQVDVFSGWAFAWAEAAGALLHRLGRPFVLTLHGGNLPAFARRHPQRVRRLLQSAAAVTVPSRYLLEQMSPYAAKLQLLPNPLDLNCLPFRLRRRAVPHLIWVRAFHNIYNPPLAARVVRQLQNEGSTVALTMLGHDKGDGSWQETQRVAAALGVSEHMQCPGGVPKSEVPHWLGQADIFINTTNVDNTPVSVLEAMACGLCVVSTDAGGLPYLLTHEHDALLVPCDDARAMAAAVRRILDEPGLAERLSHNARCTAQQFAWTDLLPRWEKLLLESAISNSQWSVSSDC